MSNNAEAPEPHSRFGPSDGIPSAGDFENDLQRGYAAWGAGDPFSEYQTAEWMDGWKAADDFAWWKRLAAALGGSVHGFSHRYSGSLNIKGQIHSLDGSLLDAVVALLPASAIEAATAGETTKIGSTVGESAVPDRADAQPEGPTP